MLGLEYASGKLNICELIDARTAAEKAAGSKPKEKLGVIGWTYYGDRNISYSRVYQALGADRRIDRIIRVPVDVLVEPGNYVIIGGTQYRVDIATAVIVKSNYRATELTLIKVEDRYDLVTEQN